MILYFTGTGNSKYLAYRISKEINDNIVSINDLIKNNITKELVSKDKPFVFVCPTYAWRLPRIVTDFIKKTKFCGSNKVYFIMTCGQDVAKSIKYIKKLCNDKNWHLKGFAEVVMPENYIALFEAPDKITSDKMIEDASKLISNISLDILNDRDFEILSPNCPLGTIKSGIVNSLFYKFIVSAKGFYFTKDCIGCGKCEKLCPLNNITLEDKKPHWQNNCTHCMACICGCPVNAIEYKNKTQNKKRYYLE